MNVDRGVNSDHPQCDIGRVSNEKKGINRSEYGYVVCFGGVFWLLLSKKFLRRALVVGVNGSGKRY